ncbi:hypothetical protein BGZ70_003362, partial [Mortierella alpina]
MDANDRTDLGLYSQLPEETRRSAGLDSRSVDSIVDSRSFVPNYVQNAVVQEFEADKVYNTKVKNKVFMLDNPTKDSTAAKEERKRRRRANKAKALTAKEKRTLDVYDIPLESR